MLFLFAKILLLIIPMLLLTACGEDYYNEYEDYEYEPEIIIGTFEAAVEAGLLMDLQRAEATAVIPRTAPVEISHLSLPQSSRLNVNVNVTEPMSFDNPYTIFNGFYVSLGEIVREGDILASASPEVTDFFAMHHRNARNDLSRFESDFAQERVRRQIEMDDTQIEIDRTTGSVRERHMLNLEIQRLRYEQYVLDTNRTIYNMRRAIEAEAELIDDEFLIAPFDGIIVDVASIRIGSQTQRRHMITVARSDSVFFSVNANNFHTFRYGDILPAEVGDLEFHVQVVNDPFATGTRDGQHLFLLSPIEPGIFEELLYRYDNSWDRIWGRGDAYVRPIWNMFGEGIVISNGIIQTAPSRHGGPGSPYVTVYENGTFGRRFITVAPYVAMSQVVVISGLYPGQEVVGHR